MSREIIIPIGALLISLGVGTYAIYLASERELSSLENVLLQFFCLAFGIAGSYAFGKLASRQEERKHARSAFRRQLSLYEGYSRILQICVESTDCTAANARAELNRIEEVANTQVSTADAAMYDWEDLVPDAVGEVRTAIKNRNDLMGLVKRESDNEQA